MYEMFEFENVCNKVTELTLYSLCMKTDTNPVSVD